MKTLRNIVCLALTLAITTTAFGQKPKGDRKAHKEKIQAMKVSYITEKLDLTTKEAQQFWPLYNEYDSKMDKTRRSMRKMHKKENSIDQMTDTEVEQMIISINNARQQELDIQKEYHSKFKTILPIKKIAKLHKAEHGFKRDLLKKLKNHKGDDSHRHPGPPPH
jgi:Spy/CpxP family protein refolding chaperone